MSFEKVAKMIALMHKHGIDVELMKYGYGLLKNTKADELELLEHELNSYKQLMSENTFIQEDKATEESKINNSSK